MCILIIVCGINFLRVEPYIGTEIEWYAMVCHHGLRDVRQVAAESQLRCWSDVVGFKCDRRPVTLR